MTQKLKCSEIYNLISRGGQLIDVRSHVEFNQGSMLGAISMPLETIEYFAGTIDKKKPVLLYCRTGRRSESVLNYMRNNGFEEVYNMGGYQSYAGIQY